MQILLVASVLFAGLGGLLALYLYRLFRRLQALPNQRKKVLIKETINGVFVWFEERGLLPRSPTFNRDYLRDYPALKILEDNVDVIRSECLALLDIKEKLVDMREAGGGHTTAGVHTVKWKTFMFKAGVFVEPNCELCPKTADMLRKIPGVYTAFFSLLEPHQHVLPHWGYYKGFQRYHLGVFIPGDNADRKCYLRVNSDPADNAARNPDLVAKGETYYWKNGEGIVFDDNYLHEAENGSDEVRVVLWLDLRRKMPFYIQAFNMVCMEAARRDKSMQRVRDAGLVEH